LSEYELRNGTPAWQVAYLYLGSRLLGAVRPVTTARLTVTKAGWGSGRVMAAPAALDCGATCTARIALETAVTLTAAPDAGSVFTTWSGTGCTDGPVTMSVARTCTATFQPVVGAPRMSIDTPTAGVRVQPLQIAGWAIDVAAATGSGVDTVHVWAYPNPGSGTPPLFLGAATYGGDRPDVGAAFGDARFRYSSYSLTTTALAPNAYQLVVYAHSTFTGTFNLAQTVDIQIPTTNPAMSIDTPGNWAQVGATFTIAGWAIDRNAPSGVGWTRWTSMPN